MHRSIAKTISYSAIHLIVAFGVAFTLTGNLAAALAIGLIEPLVQTFAYHFHEKAWGKFPQLERATPQLTAG